MAWLLLFACSGASAPHPPTDAPVAPAPLASAPPPAAPVAPTWRGDFCRADADCGWDDPCAPRRCGTASASPGVACEESARPSGSCACVEQQCTTRLADPARGVSEGACTTDAECAIDVGTGTCHAGGTTLIGPVFTSGPLCTCNGGRCAPAFVEPIPCTSWRECDLALTPRLRPVRAATPRTKQVTPCKDGEKDAICNDAGFCQVVAWRC